ncbi:hypothetical protein AS589_09410 [Empedobacter brevis]|uniref:phage portal protein n=1 Tax=Empedobacter brevis TaxID=247 RepID=UPI00131F9DBD|nr:phage portal protein [Empedobacter brevis]QHC84972.1 hypothetical protein AS589_09410 [Empedobacter brevis]
MRNFIGNFFPFLQQRRKGSAEMYFNYSYDSGIFNLPNFGDGFVSLAQNIDAFDSPITFLCDLFKKGFIYAKDKEGNIVENDPLVKLLNKPNRFQTKEQLLSDFYYFLTAAGWTNIYPFHKSIGFEKKIDGKNELFILNPDKISFEDFNSDIFSIDSVNFKYHLKGAKESTKRRLNTKEVIQFTDVRVDPDNPFKGLSRLASLTDEGENTLLANRGKKNQIKRTGSLLVTHKEHAKDQYSDGLDEVFEVNEKTGKPKTYKDEIEKELNMLGLSQGKSIAISSKELQVLSLAKDILGINFDLMIAADRITISNKIGVPIELLPTKDINAKYDNRENAELQVIQNRIEPVAEMFCKKIREYFDYEHEICMTYDHLPAYQLVNQQIEDRKTKTVERLKLLKEMGWISDEKAQKILQDHDIISEM